MDQWPAARVDYIAAPALFFRGLLSVHFRYSLHARQVAQGDPLHQRLQQLRYLHCCSDCYRVERTRSRAGLSPLWTSAFHGARKYLNNVVEQDHRTVKKRTWLAKGYGSLITAWRTLQGIEAMDMIRKGRARWVTSVLSEKSVYKVARSSPQSNRHRQSI